jgi:hypothetical protein
MQVGAGEHMSRNRLAILPNCHPLRHFHVPRPAGHCAAVPGRPDGGRSWAGQVQSK